MGPEDGTEAQGVSSARAEGQDQCWSIRKGSTPKPGSVLKNLSEKNNDLSKAWGTKIISVPQLGFANRSRHSLSKTLHG